MSLPENIGIGGMSCATCVRRVEKTLARLEGVAEARVNLAAGRALLLPEKDRAIDLALVEAAVSAAGFVFQGRVSSRLISRQEDEAQRRERFLTVKVALGMVLSLLIMAFSMPESFPVLEGLPTLWLSRLAWILTSLVLFGVGSNFFQAAYAALRQGAADMNTLVILGALSAYVYSVLIYLRPSFLKLDPAAAHLYFDGAAMIVTLVLLGRLLEFKARRRASQAIRKLYALQPPRARVVRGDGFLELPIEDLRPGDLIQMRPGERLPVDGRLRGGSSSVDESMLTGESRPQRKAEGDEVFAGTLNQLGSFVFEVTRIGDETTLGQIIQLVDEAQSSKAPIQRFADRVAAIFVPVVLGLAGLTFLVWFFLVPAATFNQALLHAISVLIIACPCAMGLATPTAIMVGTGIGARHGIILKGGEVLERVQRLSTVVFDKTGTLTAGSCV